MNNNNNIYIDESLIEIRSDLINKDERQNKKEREKKKKNIYNNATNDNKTKQQIRRHFSFFLVF